MSPELTGTQVTFNAKGQITGETVVSRSGADVWISTITNSYVTTAGLYTLGALASVSTSDSKNGVYQYVTTTTNSLAWRDGAIVTGSTFAKTSQTTYATTYTYGLNGAVESVFIGGGRPRTVTFTNDLTGQAVRRDEQDYLSGGDPHEIWYRHGGKQLGHVTNNGLYAPAASTGSGQDYGASVSTRAAAPLPGNGAFRGGHTAGHQLADFDQSVSGITTYGQGGMGGSYQVQAGDTLAGIAANLWGDSSLWYKLAESNGLSAGAALTEGQRLTIPPGVMKNTHNAGTFKPYDPSEVLGDLSTTSPTAQAAAKKNKCGMFGQILLVAISVAVSFALPALAPGVFGGILGGAGAAMIGSAVSQGVGLATGIQDKFSWKGVALAGLSAGVGAGIGKAFDGITLAGSKFVTDVVRGAAGSVITQGIAVATGLQDKFDWAGVAAAGLGAGVGGGVSRGLMGKAESYKPDFWNTPGRIGHDAIVSMADTIAQATARSLVEGTSFGDNLLAALPSAIGNTIGNGLARTIQQSLIRAKETQSKSATSLSENSSGLMSQPEEFVDPDNPFETITRDYSFEEIGKNIQENLPTVAFSALVQGGTEVMRLHPLTTDLAMKIMDLFSSDSAQRTLRFYSGTSEGDAAWHELLTSGPSDYHNSYLQNALWGLVVKSNGQRDASGNWIIHSNAAYTGARADNEFTDINRLLDAVGLPTIARGDFVNYMNLADGAQLGDVVGTFTSNMDAKVDFDRQVVVFEAKNVTTLNSAFFANVLGGVVDRVINPPTHGRYSPVYQEFRYELPFSQINNAVFVRR